MLGALEIPRQARTAALPIATSERNSMPVNASIPARGFHLGLSLPNLLAIADEVSAAGWAVRQRRASHSAPRRQDRVRAVPTLQR
jgi:hypothetical protein